MIWCIKTYIIAYVKAQKIRYIIHYVKYGLPDSESLPVNSD